MSYQGFGPIPKGKKTATLRLAAGLALALALLILFLGWVSTRWAEPDRAARDGRSTAIRRSWAAVDRFPSVAAVLLLSGGVAALALATPLDNSDARASGYQRITTNPVTPGHWDGADFGDELAIFRTSLVGDVHLSFQMLVPKLPIHIHRFTANVVVASDGNRGILFQVSTTGQLRALVGERYLPVPGSIPLSAKVPTDKWVTVAVDIERDQSFSFTIDHQQVSVFAYALPALNALPIGFSAGGGFYGTFGGYVRNAVMTVHLYNPGSPQSDHDAQRGVQILGAIAVALGVMLLCRRWLRNLVPLTENTKRPIIFAAFGTAGALIVLPSVRHLQEHASLRHRSGHVPACWILVGRSRVVDESIRCRLRFPRRFCGFHGLVDDAIVRVVTYADREARRHPDYFRLAPRLHRHRSRQR